MQPARRPTIVFAHLTLGAQFEFFGQWLQRNGWDVHFVHSNSNPGFDPATGVRTWRFQPMKSGSAVEPAFHILTDAGYNASAAGEMFHQMRQVEGIIPDVIVSHVGWGVGLMAKTIWPESLYIAYHEWYYGNLDWQSGRPSSPKVYTQLLDMRLRNLVISSEFDTAVRNWCPTHHQAAQFPPNLRSRIDVIPDGVDTLTCRPDPDAVMDTDWLKLPKGRPVLTYATRGMEPLRGFPQFLAGLAELQKRRDDFSTVILADERVAYGTPLAPGDSWRIRMINELDLDQRRLHVFPMRSRKDYNKVLQVSSAHVYFTEPFVTSWSLTEAMASGCLVIGSNTAPVEEMLEDQETGILVDMDDPEEIADMIEWAFDNPLEAALLRARARETIIARYDAERVFAMKADMLRELIAQHAGVAVPT